MNIKDGYLIYLQSPPQAAALCCTPSAALAEPLVERAPASHARRRYVLCTTARGGERHLHAPDASSTRRREHLGARAPPLIWCGNVEMVFASVSISVANITWKYPNYFFSFFFSNFISVLDNIRNIRTQKTIKKLHIYN